MRRAYHRVTGATGVRGLISRMRASGVRPEDAFIRSYPRSGSTWLRFLLFELLTGRSATFDAVNRDIPNVRRHRTATPMLPDGGRLIISHDLYEKPGHKVVYVVRDVRDVLLSEHDYQQMRKSYSGSLDSYLADALAGRVHQYGSWQEHVARSLSGPAARSGQLLLVRYEEMKREPVDALAEILRFLGVSREREAIRSAVENNNLGRMRAKEDEARREDVEAFRGVKRDHRFVNAGATGGWRSKLTDDQLSVLEHRAGSSLKLAGYAL